MKVVVAGGTGLIGSSICKALVANSCSVFVLSRSGKGPVGTTGVAWDGVTVGPWVSALDEAHAVINLVGERIAQRWTADAQRRIIDSRVRSTLAIGEAIETVPNKPKVWINGSAIGYYGYGLSEAFDEASPLGRGFLPEVCRQWEDATRNAHVPDVRRVFLRTGHVLSTQDGLLPPLLNITRKFLGGAAGNGKQYMSWIHINDLTQMTVWAMNNPNIEGPLNGTAPVPVTNGEFMAGLRRACHRPWCPPAPAFMFSLLEPLTGVEPELILRGQRVLPLKSEHGGFQFQFRTLELALNDLIRA
ncbi:MAG: TIGR01777 family oxidoreductase [Armatimonadetes bacterium]|nr:TIGR01777 family oxidoreductase [Armatimonadota bacterium]